jgi:site-specific DNA recombinase
MDSILLCRISDLKQDDGYSLDAQERFGKEYCKKNGFDLKQTFRFVETGSKSHKREKFDGMMDYIRDYVAASKNKMLQLVVEKPDRLTRNFTNREQLQFFVMTGRLVIHYYKDRRIFDRNCSPADIFTDDMMTSVSKYIALNIARESQKGMAEKAKNGWFPGHAPFGYKNIREGSANKNGRKEAKVVPDESTKKALQRIFELRALQGLSYYAIRDKILEESLLPPNRAKNFKKSTVESVLVNPFYGGKFLWKNELHEGKHELIVPVEWIRLVDGKRGKSNKPGPVGSFSYFMTCATPGCGCTVIYDPKTKTNKTNDKIRTYHYYHCCDAKRFHKEQKIKQVNVSEQRLWELFAEPIRSLSISEDLAGFVWDHITQLNQESATTTREAHEKANVRVTDLIKKEDELYEHWASGLLTKEAYARHLEKIKAEREELSAKLEALENIDNKQIERSAKSLLELCKRAESAWNKGSSDERLNLIKRVCSNFQMEGPNLRYDFKKPFRILAQIKNNGVSKSWCPGPDLNRHARLTRSSGF